MEKKTTCDIERALAGSESLDGFLRENEEEFTDGALRELLQRLFDRRAYPRPRSPRSRV